MAAKKEKENQEKSPKPSQFNRHPALYIGSVVILVIIVVTFVGGPLVGGGQTEGRIVFGEYNGEEIAYVPGNFFARQYEAIANQVRSQGDNTNLQLQLRQIWREAFNRTIFHTAVTQRAEAAGMRITESRIDRAVAQLPQFQENGRFSAERYQNTSSSEIFALRRFVEESLRYERVVADVIDGPKVSEGEIAFFREMAGPERRFSFVRIPFSAFPDSEVVAFAEDNESQFESVELQVINLRGSREEAEEIHRQAVEGESPFEDLAREHSTGALADQGGDLGRTFAFELQRDLADGEDAEQVFATAEGEIAPLVETPQGGAIYRVNSPVRGFDPADPQDLERVRSYMETFERGFIEDFVREQAERLAGSAREESLESAADAEGLEVSGTEFFPINYGDAPYFSQLSQGEGEQISEAAQTERFFLEAFGLEEGEISQPIVLRRAVVVLRMDEEREVEEEETEFLADYYPFLAQENQSRQIRLSFIDEEKLEDNFIDTFNRVILGPTEE
ncbi:MAG: peptidylprolyl isomerase [Alkalispirochaetaceae bacterium]